MWWLIGDVAAHMEMLWLIGGDVVAHWYTRQTSEAEVPGLNPASPTMIDPGALQDHCVIL